MGRFFGNRVLAATLFLWIALARDARGLRRADSAGRIEVVDNVSIAPRCPVQTGDRVEIRGEMVHDRGRPPLVHWTHHDPRHHHNDGFIRLDGRIYA